VGLRSTDMCWDHCGPAVVGTAVAQWTLKKAIFEEV
jgi:hypothetical protein